MMSTFVKLFVFMLLLWCVQAQDKEEIQDVSCFNQTGQQDLLFDCTDFMKQTADVNQTAIVQFTRANTEYDMIFRLEQHGSYTQFLYIDTFMFEFRILNNQKDYKQSEMCFPDGKSHQGYIECLKFPVTLVIRNDGFIFKAHGTGRQHVLLTKSNVLDNCKSAAGCKIGFDFPDTWPSFSVFMKGAKLLQEPVLPTRKPTKKPTTTIETTIEPVRNETEFTIEPVRNETEFTIEPVRNETVFTIEPVRNETEFTIEPVKNETEFTIEPTTGPTGFTKIAAEGVTGSVDPRDVTP